MKKKYTELAPHNRFWFHSERGYTQEELAFREFVIKAREKSAIYPDYLNNPSTWFSSDDLALVNMHPNSWIHNPVYSPRHTISSDDFNVPRVNSQSLEWSQLYDLMQNIGDYLQKRNKRLPKEHLNQPMNYVLLDLNNILKGLSQNPNKNQVKEQLELVSAYIRRIETNTSPLQGSDRLFLANLRDELNQKIIPKFSNLINSQLLQTRFNKLNKSIKELSTARNRLLHFALTTGEANPHSYEFSMSSPEEITQFPTQAAKRCITKTQAVTQGREVLAFDPQKLSGCPELNLIDGSDNIVSYYAQALSELEQLDQFNYIIEEVGNLLNQAGEVYTIQQFREQMLVMLTQIDRFIEQSGATIETIIRLNDEAYYEAIRNQQQHLSSWKRYLSSNTKIKNFITNQDNLAKTPSSSTDFVKKNDELRSAVNEVIHHLNQSPSRATHLKSVTDQSNKLNNLMLSMQHWVQKQRPNNVLPLSPPPPPPLPLAATETSPPHLIPMVNIRDNRSFYFSSSSPRLLTSASSAQPQLIESTQAPNSSTSSLAWGLALLVPATVIVFYLLSKSQEKKSTACSKEEFDYYVEKSEDLLTEIAPNVDTLQGDILIADYEKVKAKQKAGKYNTDAKELYDDLDYLHKSSAP